MKNRTLLAFLFSLSISINICSEEVVRFAVISDMNKSYGSTRYLGDLDNAVKYIRDHQIPLVLSTGDMVAGQKKNLDYYAMWSAFHKKVTFPFRESNVLFAPSPGNHDASSFSAFKKEREIYGKTWKQNRSIRVLPNGNYPFYYALAFKEGLFISIDATQSRRLPVKQMSWLKETLESHRHKKLKVIFGHIPLYPYAFNRAHDYIAKGNQTSELEAVLDEYDVDLFLSGHHHVFYPGKRFGKTAFVSVPLLGTGKRKLLADGNKTTPRGFLVVDFKENELLIKAIDSTTLQAVKTSSLPLKIQIPSRDSKTCRGCANFPSKHFLDDKSRTIYHRIDL